VRRLFITLLVALSVGSVGAAAASAPTWTAEPVAPDGAGLVLHAVKCKAANMCVAVGANHAGPVAERWNGSTWKVMRPATPRVNGDGAVLNAVACSDARHCTAVGYDGCGGAFAERWNGARWTLENVPAWNSPPCGLGAPLASVACTSLRYCIAVGNDNAYTWNGKRWRGISAPKASEAVLNAVSCEGPNRCAAVGSWLDGDLLSWWNGHRWKVTRHSGNRGRFSVNTGAVSCTPDRSCMAVGSDADDSVAVAYQWNGKTWIDRSPTAGQNFDGFSGISCTSRRACLVSSVLSGDPIAVTWNGRSWSPDSARLAARPAGISCVSASVCMIVGAPDDESTTIPVSLRNY
jgi:hypothetical protein